MIQNGAFFLLGMFLVGSAWFFVELRNDNSVVSTTSERPQVAESPPTTRSQITNQSSAPNISRGASTDLTVQHNPIEITPVEIEQNGTDIDFVPIPLLAEHAALVEKPHSGPTLAELHQQLEHEVLDAGWAIPLQQNISDYIYREWPDTIDLLSVDCRATMCELQAHSYSPEQQSHTNAGDFDQWLQVIAGMRQEDWFHSIATLNLSIQPSDGKAVVVTILHRHE